MRSSSRELVTALQEMSDRLQQLEHEAELIKTVLVVKEPGTVHAANAYEGLRKQVIAATGERRTHLAQLAAMAVAVARAGSVDDLRPQVREWLQQAGVVEIWAVPEGAPAQDLFEDVDGGSLEGVSDLEVGEPAYIDANTGALLRLGRARAAVLDSLPVHDRGAH
ncbi:hypothetical protein [Blastococcus sp. SYSU DS0617]